VNPSASENFRTKSSDVITRSAVLPYKFDYPKPFKEDDMPETQSHSELYSLPEADHERLARAVMKRQAALSLQVAAIFVIILLGLPLVNGTMPIANKLVGGFTASWLFLGVLFFPITCLLAVYFVRQSDRIEAECSDWRAVLGIKEGEPLEPEGVGDIKPSFIESDLEHNVEDGK
jgi:hypothetical protein